MEFELLANFLLFCVGQGLVLMGVLAQKKFRKRHNRLLQGFLFLLIIYYFLTYSQIKELFLSRELLTAMAQPLELGIVILFFFYCRTLFGIKEDFKWLQIAKWIVFAIVFGWLFFSFFFFMKPAETEVLKDYSIVSQFVRFLVRSWFIILPIVLLFSFRNNRSWCKFLFAPIKQGEDWIRLTLMIVVVHGVFRISVVAGTGTSFVSVLEGIDLAFFLIITYILSFVFISAPETMYHRLELVEIKKEKQKKSRYSDEEIRNFIQRMDKLMQEEKLYLDSEFSLGDFSSRLGLSVHHLSEIINQGHGLNFNDYINRFRVEEFKRLLQEPRFARENLLGVAFEAGFNSKTTFNTSFKKFTGMTPSDFKRSLKV